MTRHEPTLSAMATATMRSRPIEPRPGRVRRSPLRCRIPCYRGLREQHCRICEQACRGCEQACQELLGVLK